MSWTIIEATRGNNPCPLAMLYKPTLNLYFYFATLIKGSPLSLSDPGLQDQHQCYGSLDSIGNQRTYIVSA